MPEVVLALASLLLLPFYSYELGPDAISYLSIAKEYSLGYWHEAVNAYWSPLFSWIIAGLLRAGIPDIFAMKSGGILSGMLTFYGLRRLTLLLSLEPKLRKTTLWVGCAMIVGYVAAVNTPDLLFTGLLLLYLSVTLHPGYLDQKHSGLLAGIFGGLSYLAKSYGLIFFLVHFSLFNFRWWWLRRTECSVKSRAARQFGTGLLVFSAVSIAWIFTLHTKYQRWTSGTSGEYNLRLVGPESSGYPHLRQILPPSSRTAANSWEDPLLALLPAWKVNFSWTNLLHESNLIGANLRLASGFWMHAAPLTGTSLLVFLVLLLNNNKVLAREIGGLFLSTAVFSVGYILVVVEDRYFWITNLLLLCITFLVLGQILAHAGLTLRATTALCAVTVLSFLIAPVSALQHHLLLDRSLYRLAHRLKQTRDIQGNLASCANWRESAYVAYFLGNQYYGLTEPELDADDEAIRLNPDYKSKSPSSKQALQAGRIEADPAVRYLLVWPACGAVPNTGREVAKGDDVQVVEVNRPSAGANQ